MKRPDPLVVRQAADVSRQYQDLMVWLADWRMAELERLPRAVEHTGIYQGRCQVLEELYEFLRDAPNLAAKS